MRVLVLSPDYASHYYPLSALGQELVARGHDVVVATGRGLAPRVAADGFEYRELVLGPGQNDGLARLEAQPGGEADHLQAFFDATREGMIATLRYQAEARQHDLLWRPAEVTQRLAEILADVDPQEIVSDQLAFSATLALRALGKPFVSFHPGHPSQIPGPGQVFGFPACRPRSFTASETDLSELWALCVEVSERFTETFNDTLRELDRGARPVVTAFATGSSRLTLVNYPEQLTGGRRVLHPGTTRFVGASVRRVELPTDLAGLLAADRPGYRVYVSLGSFLSARTDVLTKIAGAFAERPVQLLLASGITSVEELGSVPESWIVREHFPQPAIVPSCDLVVTHGGNNTVTEALWAGVPLLVAPFSTDQFDGAEDIRRAGLGATLAPNDATPEEIGDLADAVLASDAPRRAAALGRRLRRTAGPPLAARLIEDLPRGRRRRAAATPVHA